MSYQTRREQVDGLEVIRLIDSDRDLTASLLPQLGNIAFELTLKGKNYLWHPPLRLSEMAAKHPMMGVPLLSPWANRLDQDSYWINGAQYTVNRKLGNIRDDQNHKPIHGLVLYEPWEVMEVTADGESARATSRFRFTRQPKLMAQFPFAHELHLEHTLKGGRLSVRLKLRNESAEPIPIAIGFHPYFTLPEAPRDSWKIDLPVKEHVELSPALIPTGKTEPVAQSNGLGLANKSFDDVFTGLTRNQDGYAVFRVESAHASLSTGFGPGYHVGVVYSPQSSNFICFEPMAALTDAFNLAHMGLYNDLRSVPPEQDWEEEFWIEPQGS